MNHVMTQRRSSSTGTFVSSDTSTTSGQPVLSRQVLSPGRTAIASKKIESAVYSHIRAMRALGRTKVETAEIAKSLGLSVSAVNRTLETLRKKGVKEA